MPGQGFAGVASGQNCPPPWALRPRPGCVPSGSGWRPPRTGRSPPSSPALLPGHRATARRHALAILQLGEGLLAFASLFGLTTLPAALAGEPLDLCDLLRGQAACQSRQALPSLPMGFSLFLQGGLHAPGGLFQLVRAAAIDRDRPSPPWPPWARSARPRSSSPGRRALRSSHGPTTAPADRGYPHALESPLDLVREVVINVDMAMLRGDIHDNERLSRCMSLRQGFTRGNKRLIDLPFPSHLVAVRLAAS